MRITSPWLCVTVSLALHMSHFPLTMNRIHFISRRFVSKPHLRPSKQSKERLSSALFSSYTLPPPHNHGLAPIPLKNGQKLVALGDIHGDFSALVRALKVAQVIDQAATVTLETIESVAWVGGERAKRASLVTEECELLTHSLLGTRGQNFGPIGRRAGSRHIGVQLLEAFDFACTAGGRKERKRSHAIRQSRGLEYVECVELRGTWRRQ